MTRRENLLERLEAINPVPDASRLYDDLEAADRLAGARVTRGAALQPTIDLDDLVPGSRTMRPRRGITVAAVAAVLALIVGAGLLFSSDPVPDVGVGGRTLDVLFEGTADDASCTIRGPSTVSAGTIAIVFRNEAGTPGTDFMDFARLDPGRTEEEIREFVSSDFSDRPSWTTSVAQFDAVQPGVVSRDEAVTVEPGLYALVCGANTEGGGIIPEFGVLAGMIEVVPAG